MAAMSSSTQRYITFALGKGDFNQLQKVFQTSVNIHLLVALVVLFLGETVGLCFFMKRWCSLFSNRSCFLGISIFNCYYDGYDSKRSL